MPEELGLELSEADSSRFDVGNDKIGSRISKIGVQSILDQLSSREQASAKL